MVYNWNSAFEGYPSGADFGSVSAKALHDAKLAFKERMEAQHTFDESATPVMSHKLGKCSVVKDHGDTLDPSNVEGSMHLVEDVLYRDIGGNTQVISSINHQDFLSRDDDDHTQYYKVAGDTITGVLNIPMVLGLPVTGSFTKDDMLSQVIHYVTDATGAKDHEDDCISGAEMFTDIDIPLAKLNQSYQSPSISITDGGQYEITFAGLSSWPVCETAVPSGVVYLNCSQSLHDDFVGGFAVERNNSGDDGTYYFHHYRFA